MTLAVDVECGYSLLQYLPSAILICSLLKSRNLRHLLMAVSQLYTCTYEHELLPLIQLHNYTEHLSHPPHNHADLSINDTIKSRSCICKINIIGIYKTPNPPSCPNTSFINKELHRDQDVFILNTVE